MHRGAATSRSVPGTKARVVHFLRCGGESLDNAEILTGGLSQKTSRQTDIVYNEPVSFPRGELQDKEYMWLAIFNYRRKYRSKRVFRLFQNSTIAGVAGILLLSGHFALATSEGTKSDSPDTDTKK